MDFSKCQFSDAIMYWAIEISQDNLLPKNANLIYSFLSTLSYFSAKNCFLFHCFVKCKDINLNQDPDFLRI